MNDNNEKSVPHSSGQESLEEVNQSLDDTSTQYSNDEKTASEKREDDKAQRFSHLKDTANVITSKNGKGILGALIGIGAVALISIVMFSGGSKQTVKKPSQTGSGLTSNTSYILQENERRLAQLQSHSTDAGQHPMQNPFATVQSSQESKQMKARRNAPTQMYVSSTLASAVSTNDADTATSGSHNVFAGHGAFSQFGNQHASQAPIVTAQWIAHPYFTVAQGEFIHAVLETAINSDLPGMVRAVVTRPVYAYRGEKPLIPAGSRLIGQYTSMASNGAASTRIFVIWTRVITPSGISIMINSPGTDALGRAGMGADAVNSHFFKIFGSAALLSLMSYQVSTAGVGTMDQPNSADQYRQGIAQSLNETGQALLNKNLNIKPTIHIYQGKAINVFVARDLDLYNVLNQDKGLVNNNTFIYRGQHV